MMKFYTLMFLINCTVAQGQVPDAWFHRDLLEGSGPAWWGAGLWAGAGQGPAATLVDSLGLGNAVQGAGFHLEGGARAGAWDVAGEVLGVRAPDGQARLLLYRSHALWHGPGGWLAGFDQELCRVKTSLC